MTSVFLRRFGMALAAFFLLAGAARGADDPSARGAKLFEKRHYGEAAKVLRSRLASPGAQGQAVLTLGVAYLKNAELHRAFHRTATVVVVDYLRKLVAEQPRGKNSLAVLYLGEALLAADRPAEAKTRIERFLAVSREGTAEAAVASIDLALCRIRLGEREKAKELLDSVNTADPAVRSELAAAYARAGFADKAAVAMGEEALAAMRKAGRKPSTRFLKNVAFVYARAGQAEKGIDLVDAADFSAFSREEVLKRNTALRYYDPFLLDDLATLYLAAGVFWLEKATAYPAVRDAAVYYLGEAYALPGISGSSGKAAEALAAATRLPPPYRDRVLARQASSRYAAGRKEEVVREWEQLSRKTQADPDLMAEILFACDRAGAGCQDIVGRAAAVAEAGEGKRMRGLRLALGRHFLGRKEYAKAVAYLEAGRDKGFKNKIESNDPELLAALAEVYYRVKKFSEAQEIYFEMGKSFPAVRQIQEALQGIYAREQKSPGDVRIS